MSIFLKLALTGPLLGLALASSAVAQTVPTSVGVRATVGLYSFVVGNGSISADGTITADSTGHATAITGFVNGNVPITGLSTYAGADNYLYSTGALVSFGGLSFSTATLGDFNFYNSGLGYYGLLSSTMNPGGYPDGVIATADIAAIPESTTWIMMLGGFCGIGIAMRRKAKRAIALRA